MKWAGQIKCYVVLSIPYRGCLNVYEKNMENNFQTKNQLLLLLLTVIQCKQRYTRTSLPCNVTVVDLK
jgi:hypothetical protein